MTLVGELILLGGQLAQILLTKTDVKKVSDNLE